MNPNEKTVADDVLEAMEKAPKKDDGGYAFPFQAQIRYPDSITEDVVFGGMNLRDWFAGKAIQYLEHQRISETSKKLGKDPGDLMAEIAYQIADSMIAQRKK